MFESIISKMKKKSKYSNEELVKRYLALRESNLTKATRQAYRWDLNVFLEYLGDTPLSEVTHITIDGYIQHCVEDRANGDEALSRKYNTLNKFFTTMIAKEYLDVKNPMDKVDRVKIRRKVRGHVTLEEYNMIMDHLKANNDLRGLALYSLLMSSGIRISEIHGLNRDGLDYENLEFKVLGKGQKERTCIFSDDAVVHVKNYLASRTDNLDAMFVSREHNRWSVGAIQVYVRNSAKAAGVDKRIHPHLLRHGCAMFLMDNDLPLDEIQKVLGHENISTTQIYAHTSMKKVKKNVTDIYNKFLT